MAEWAKGITGIKVVPDLGGTPARVDHYTGIIEVSQAQIAHMPKEHVVFILLHEMGHIMAHTTSELKADEWAFNQYAALGYSLKQSVFVLTRVLNENNPEHHWRMYQELLRAERYDYQHNGNQKFKNV